MHACNPPFLIDHTAHHSGLEVVAGLRGAGCHVVMGCRSHQRCSAAKELLDARGLPGSCECRLLDLNDFASIRRFAAELEGSPSLLVNNAGVMGVAAQHGTCSHWRPNTLGPYLLTRLLLPRMAARARIVTVASEAHRRGSLHISSDGEGRRLEDGGGAGGWYAQYARSKLANVLMTAELSRRLEQRGSTVTCSSVSPGRVNTGIYSNVPGWLRTPLRWLAAAAFQTPAQGASTVLHAAMSPELGRHELYLHAMRPCRASPAAYDAKLAGELWQLSNQQVGLSAAEDAALWPPH
jgi:NAD(P)-dependent dehydrogenase (short-subunit alcohol dehydrogenase family)